MDTVGQDFIDAFNRRDAEGLVALVDAEIAVHPTPLIREHGVHYGHDGLRRWLKEASSLGHRLQVHEGRTLDESHFLVLADVLVGDVVVSPLAMLGELNEAGKVVEVHAFLSDERTLERLEVTTTHRERSVKGPA